MSDPTPVVYLLHGEDEFAIHKFILAMEEKLGDPATAEMNISRLEGAGLDFDALKNASGAMPFLASRRLVIVENAAKKLNSKPLQEKFFSLVDDLPPTTALVLQEFEILKDKSWLLKWAGSAGGRVLVKAFPLLKGAQLAQWIRKFAQEQGGEIEPQAAHLLAELAGDSPRTAALEIEKLLAYVNYARPVDIDDVENLTAFASGGGDFFVLMEAIGRQDGRKAMDMLMRLFDEQDPFGLFFSLVGHFRLLLQAREIYEGGGQEGTVAQALGIHPFRAKKLTAQAKTISLPVLESIYRRLAEYDLQIKSGQIDAALALETLVATLTAQRVKAA